jgi:hypothetical protein
MPKPIRMENLVPGRVAKSRIATLVLACAFVVGATAPAAFAAPNPSGTGQPNQECEDVQPPASAAEVSKTPRPTTRVRLVRHRQQMLVVRMRSRSTMLPAFSRNPTGTNETQVDLFVALSSAGDRSALPSGSLTSAPAWDTRSALRSVYRDFELRSGLNH